MAPHKYTHGCTCGACQQERTRRRGESYRHGSGRSIRLIMASMPSTEKFGPKLERLIAADTALGIKRTARSIVAHWAKSIRAEQRAPRMVKRA